MIKSVSFFIIGFFFYAAAIFPCYAHNHDLSDQYHASVDALLKQGKLLDAAKMYEKAIEA